MMLRRIGKIFLFALAGLIVMGYLFVDAVSCGPVSKTFLPGHGLTGGPHYFQTFNHGCWPWDPQSLYTDGTTPEKTEFQVIAAWFDDKQRLIKTQKYLDRGKPDWWQEISYDARGKLRTVKTGGSSATRLYEYENGWLVRESEISPAPAPAK